VRNCFEWDFAAAEHGYRRAIELDPSYATAFHWLGLWLHAVRGRSAEAVGSLEQAVELDPLSPPIIADLGLAHAFGESFDAAAMYFRRALSVDPTFHRPYWFLGLASAWNGNFEAAEDALKRGLDLCPGAAFRSRLLGALGFAYGRWEERHWLMMSSASSRRCARPRTYRPSNSRKSRPARQLRRGAGVLEHAVVHRDTYAIFLKSWNTFAPLRQLPRFRALLAQIGLD
jgi:tetratricopeptide (TPR) repeat protein